MKIHQDKEGKRQRRILIDMITNQAVLARVASSWDGELFLSREFNRIGQWCVEHYQKHGQAPGKSIEIYFEEWKEHFPNEAEIDIVGSLLGGLSEEYDTSANEVNNPQHEIDIAGRMFNHFRMTRLKEKLEAYLEAGKDDSAETLITKYSRVEMGSGAGIHLLTDKEAILSTFDKDNLEPLVTYPEPLGGFFHRALERTDFIVFTGPQKAGKSRWLVDLTWRAVSQRRKVAYFQVGDLPELDVKGNFLVRITGRPIYSDDGKWPTVVKYPTNITYHKKEIHAEVETRDKFFKRPLTGNFAWEACQKILSERVKTKKSLLQISCHSNMSISILGIKSIIESWDLTGFTPDIIVIDYADNLAPVDKREEVRERVNTTWKLMRSLALDRNCLLVTASQVNAAGFTKKVLDRTNFSEDNRKLSHVTGMIGLNVSPEEKDRDITRINWIVKRKTKYNVYRCWHCAGCSTLGNPCVKVVF